MFPSSNRVSTTVCLLPLGFKDTLCRNSRWKIPDDDASSLEENLDVASC